MSKKTETQHFPRTVCYRSGPVTRLFMCSAACQCVLFEVARMPDTIFFFFFGMLIEAFIAPKMINQVKLSQMQTIFSGLLLTKPSSHYYQLGGWFTRKFNSWALAIRIASSPQEALQLYTQMQQQAVPFDSYSVLFTLKSCSRLQNLTLIQHLHAHLFKIGFSSHVYVATSLLHAYVVSSFEEACKLFDEMPEKNTVTFNTMITGYFKSGDAVKAHSVFDNMPIKNLGSWSAMITGYMGGGSWDKGLSLLLEMIFYEGLKPDQVAFGSILSRCSNMGYNGLLVGKSIHGFIERDGWNLNVEIGTALVDMYTKCGLLNCGYLIFQRMNDKNVLTWSAMICGLAQHGCGEKALFMFERMKEEGVRPNEITFTGILSACTHVGLVKEGIQYFHSMVEDYGLEPRIQHYGCMVDLLGRAGRLDKAYEVIKTMKLEPNVVVWGSFLAACKLHKQFKMAEKVMQQVLKVITPESDGGIYTLISDMYASDGKWDEAQKTRDLMTKQNVKKARGSSFISSGAI